MFFENKLKNILKNRRNVDLKGFIKTKKCKSFMVFDCFQSDISFKHDDFISNQKKQATINATC